MKLALILLLIYSTALLADCQVSNGKTVFNVPESKSFSLFEKGRSLETHKTQDQDGLSTCYANTTSAVLKSILPGSPDISYTHAAVVANTHGWENNWKTGNQKYIKNPGTDSNFTGGGYVCETIAAMKKVGGGCPQKLSILERDDSMDVDIQSKLLAGLGKYYDSFNMRKKNPKALDSMKKELALAFELINYKSTELKAACEERKKSKFPSRNPFKKVISKAVQHYLSHVTPCTQNRLKRMKTLLSSESVVKADRIFLTPTADVEKGLVDILESDPTLAKSVEEFINKEDYDSDLVKDLGKQLMPKLDKFLGELTKGDEKGLGCEKDFSLPLGAHPETRSEDFLIYMRSEKKVDCQAFLNDEDNSYLLITANEQFSCLDQKSFEKILDAVVPLANLGAILDQKLSDELLNPKSVYANQVTNIVMPGCLQKKNLIKMDNVSCATFTTCDSSKWNNYDNYTYTGPKGACYKMADAKSIVRMKAINSLQTGAALGVGVCTGFMNDPKVRTDFCKKKVEGVAGHSVHEMTVSGYRCVQGKIEYEILNSWGGSCPAEDEEKNEAVECIKDKDGYLTGRFWVKEDVLVNNMYDMTSVRKNK